MGLIHVFNSLKDTETFQLNGKLEEQFNFDWEHCLILKQGQRISKDYCVKDDDIIFIRKIPADPITVAWAIGFTLSLGGFLYQNVIEPAIENRRKLAELEKAQKAAKSLSEKNTALPFIRGARNQVASGQNFPFVIGKSLFTPYTLCTPHIKLEGAKGEKQYYYLTLECGYNDLIINEIKLGETVIRKFTNTAPQNGVFAWDNGSYYDPNNVIEIIQSGDFNDDNFNDKIIYTEVSAEIPHKHATDDAEENAQIEEEWQKGIIQELPTNAKSVEIFALFDGLQKFGEDGFEKHSITLQPQWTNKNNPTESDWVNFSTGFNQNGTNSNTFSYNTRYQMRFSATQNFTGSQTLNKNIKIRVKRTTPETTESARDKVYLLAVQTTCFDPKKSTTNDLVTAKVLEPNECAKCCRIGIKCVANSNTKDMLDQISVIETGTAPTWNGTEWTQTKTGTQNLASWVYEILTSDKHKSSQYNRDELDADSFGEWYEYCEQQGFNANGVLTKAKKKKETIETLLRNGNANLVFNPMTGLIEVAIDNGREYSVAMLNSENIISISTSKEFKRKPTGKKVSYVNAQAGYDVDTVTFMEDGEPYDIQTDVLTETGLEFITDYEHAYKYAWRQMAEELANPRKVTVKVGYEGAYYPLYSRVELQHKTLKLGLVHSTVKGVSWHNGNLQQVKINGTVNFDESKNYGIILNCVSDTGKTLAYLEVTGIGKTDTLEVITPFSQHSAVIPEIGNILSFGELGENGEFSTVANTMKIIGAEETDNGYTLTLVDYNPALYEYGELPEYKTTITTIPNGNTQTIEQQREFVQKIDVESATGGIVQAAVDTVTNGVRFTNVYNAKTPAMTIEDIIRRMDEDARNASAGLSITNDEITLKVEDTEKALRSLINIQSGSITALVEGGGSTGQMALSLNLPAIVDNDTLTSLINASSQGKVSAVYGLIAGTQYFGIKKNATTQAIKTLWQDACENHLLASQIDLSATQIQMNAENVVISDGGNSQSIISGGKIRTSLIDVDTLMAQTLQLRNDGVIKSTGYVQGQSGFQIKANGEAEFNNATLQGLSYFNGISFVPVIAGTFCLTGYSAARTAVDFGDKMSNIRLFGPGAFFRLRNNYNSAYGFTATIQGVYFDLNEQLVDSGDLTPATLQQIYPIYVIGSIKGPQGEYTYNITNWVHVTPTYNIDLAHSTLTQLKVKISTISLTCSDTNSLPTGSSIVSFFVWTAYPKSLCSDLDEFIQQ